MFSLLYRLYNHCYTDNEEFKKLKKMFDTHSAHKKPKNSLQKLWRYLSYGRLIQAIEEESIYFSHISEMPDRWEGLLTIRTREMFFKSELRKYSGNVEAANGSVSQYEEFRNDFYINCWHMNDQESYLMWKVYGNRECAIQTNYERLFAAFAPSPAKIEGCVVEYIDYERDGFGIGNTYTQISFKDIPYRDEREYRLLFWKVSPENIKLNPEEKGIKIQVDINMLIDNIYLNPGYIPNIDKLEKLIKEKRLDCKIKNTKIWEK